MRTSHILLLCILGHALFASVFCNNAGGPEDCCFEYYPRTLNKMYIRSYYRTDYRCSRTAAVLTTMKNATICVDPKLPWVVRVMKSLDEKNF
ncbi:C-C motif chemokine 4-like [Trematomus bernacchii]|uniref:C-C motif chemokine 4-like n=1 Tax=Trematomus bernacchii TaxID=40690 RepID=UPI00146AB3DA|nr:C-C motif chemokine 4-like [Trematomus bernacchii]